jgi:hypothetical protein
MHHQHSRFKSSRACLDDKLEREVVLSSFYRLLCIVVSGTRDVATRETFDVECKLSPIKGHSSDRKRNRPSLYRLSIVVGGLPNATWQACIFQEDAYRTTDAPPRWDSCFFLDSVMSVHAAPIVDSSRHVC